MTLFPSSEPPFVGEIGDEAALGELSQAARKFLRSPSFEQAVLEDECEGHEASTMQFAIRTGWPEVDRSARALEIIDREIRRCASAGKHLAELENEPSEDQRISDPFVRQLMHYPEPVGVGAGALRIEAATAAPSLAVLASPHGHALSVLSRWPIATLSYVAAAFGAGAFIGLTRHCKLEGAAFGTDASRLDSLLAASPSNWPGSDPGLHRSWHQKHWRVTQRRPIARSTGAGGVGGSGVEVVLHRVLTDGREDLIAVSSAA